MKKLSIVTLVIFLTAIFCIEAAWAKVDRRQKIIELVRSAGMEKELDKPVEVSADDAGVLCIRDKGYYLAQYMVVEPNVSADANIAIDPSIKIPSAATKIVIATHGFLDKAQKDWPDDLANQIRQKTDPNQWICGYFDWRGGAAVLNPIDAAKYARDIAGPRLAKTLLKLKPDLEHVHLIAHSAGCWTINSAAKEIAEETDARIHLTFLDAFVPPSWDQSDFGKIDSNNIIWAEHYYTKDITLKSTHTDLTNAHNVDITKIDPLFKEHEFPYRWYRATVAGKYRDSDWEKKEKVITKCNGTEYGFARSAEAGRQNWQKSLTLKKGQKAVMLKKKKKPFKLGIFK